MLLPRKNSFDLWDDFFDDNFFKKTTKDFMRTDIVEKDNSYDIKIDLPGYKKEDIKIEIENAYLVVRAKREEEEHEKNKKYIHKERYYGECQRSFYVGNDIKEDEIKAKFVNGTLSLIVPKKDEKQDADNKKYIQIDE